MAIQTAHSVGEGSARPAAWRPTLDTVYRYRDDIPAGFWKVIIADRDDLASLPEAIDAWGRERVVVGALVHIPRLDLEGDLDVLLIVPTGDAYVRLCRFLSLRHEHPERIERWLGPSLGGAFSPQYAPDLAGLIALVRNRSIGWCLQEAGATVRWRCEQTPDDHLAPEFPAVALPLVAHTSAAERSGEPVRQKVARRAGATRREGRDRIMRSDLLSADELHVVSEAFAERPDLLIAGYELLAACTYVPPADLHLPPSDYENAAEVLRERSLQGVRWRFGLTPAAPVIERMERELGVFTRKGFDGYILTVHDLCKGRRTCGRGSAASSLVCYVLGITNVDPIRYNLVFERFLCDSRTDPPDIDVDFPWDERNAVIGAVIEHYGSDHVALVATHPRLRREGSLREAAKAWDLDRETTTEALALLDDERRYKKPSGLEEPWPLIIDSAGHLAGMPLQYGLHPGGTIITREPIRDLVPVHRAAKEIPFFNGCYTEDPEFRKIPVIAWEKNGAEDLGLVKIDLLGNRSLAVIRDTIDDLHEDGIHVDEMRWSSTDDPLTKRIISTGATMGCFYIESPAMRQTQAKVGSGDFDRLVIHSSIIRPAANRWINEYITRYHHVRATGQHDERWYPHSAMRGLLSESYGVLSYQEDVMLVAREIAGFDEAGANALRKALGHWDTQQRLLKHEGAFLAGCLARGATPDAAREIWANISSFAGYSFAKAHSASYAKVSFECAWLKAHHPAHFMARVVANEGGFYTAGAYLEEARRLGIVIHGPCAVHSVWKTQREGQDALRVGWHRVRGIGPRIAAVIEEERARGPFCGIADFMRRCRIPPRLLDYLARVGALDALRPDLHRDQIRWIAQSIDLDGLHRHAAEQPGAQWIFPRPPCDDPPVPRLPEPDKYRAAFARYRLLGFCPEAHPIRFTNRPDRLRAEAFNHLNHGDRVWISGCPITRKQVSAETKAGPEAMAFTTLDDETGMIEAVMFPEAFRAVGAVLDGGTPVRVHGVVQVDFGVRTLAIECAEALPFFNGLESDEHVRPSGSLHGSR